MIFVTVGTHRDPFTRLIDGLDQLPGEELVVQHGSAPPPAGVARAEAYMPFDEMLECFRTAEKVITHAGVGSVLCARREGQIPLVVPRRHDLGEHVDEHQAELTRALDQRCLIPVWDVADLAQQVEAAPARKQGRATSAEETLIVAVRAALAPNRTALRRAARRVPQTARVRPPS